MFFILSISVSISFSYCRNKKLLLSIIWKLITIMKYWMWAVLSLWLNSSHLCIPWLERKS